MRPIQLASEATQRSIEPFTLAEQSFESIMSQESDRIETFSEIKSYSFEDELRKQMLLDLHELLEMGLENDWDGEGGSQINRVAYRNACSFVRQLPFQTDMPDVSLTPDGDVSIEWIAGKNKRFGVTVKSDKLIYGGIFGEGRISGLEPYSGTSIPQIISSIISNVNDELELNEKRK